jgi:hypothetical protein
MHSEASWGKDFRSSVVTDTNEGWWREEKGSMRLKLTGSRGHVMFYSQKRPKHCSDRHDRSVRNTAVIDTTEASKTLQWSTRQKRPKHCSDRHDRSVQNT